MGKAEFSIHQLMDNCEVRNRIIDNAVRITFDSKEVRWEPGEVKTMPRSLAEWFRDKSLYHFRPGDVNEGISAMSCYKLHITGDTAHEDHDLTKDEVNAVKELLDVSNMPELTRIDPQTGKPLRRVYIDPRSTGARDNFAQRERAATKTVSSAIVKDAAERLADAAQGASEADIQAAVDELTMVNALPPTN